MIRALIFDVNGTLTNIWTNEEDAAVWRTVANFLMYQGVLLSPERLRDLYCDANRIQRHESGEEYPEFDAPRLFDGIVAANATDATRALPKKKRKLLGLLTAEVFRAATLERLELYAGVRETLKKLKKKYRLAAVSDGQTAWAYPELYAVGLAKYFDPIIVSGDFGYRKPDPRLYKKALKRLDLRPEETVFVGNDLYRDVYGARAVGMKTVFFESNQGDHDFAARPDATIGEFPELIEAVKKLDGKKSG